jgi:ABC-type dipeptide/oligopeptide/nickel transport system permease subunit
MTQDVRVGQVVGEAEQPLLTRRSTRAGWLRRLGRLARQKPLGTLAVLILAVMWLSAIFAPWVAPYYWRDVFSGPRLHEPDAYYWFGTDDVGRDVFSRIVWAGRLSLTISFAATVLGITLGSVAGVVSGYYMGWFDLIWQRLVDAMQALPGLVLLMVVVQVLGTGLPVVALALAVLTVPGSSRIIRATVISIRENPYIEAARVLGAGNGRVMLRHVLPNAFPPVLILAALSLGGNLLLQASLSFLGLVSSEYPDWGSMLNAGARRFMESAPWLAIFPGLAIMLTVFAYNMLGDTLRDVLDPRLRGR